MSELRRSRQEQTVQAGQFGNASVFATQMTPEIKSAPITLIQFPPMRLWNLVEPFRHECLVGGFKTIVIANAVKHKVNVKA